MTGLFPDAVAQVSLERQLECVRREIKLRRRLYPTKVATHRMTQRLATEEIAVMKAVEQTLVALLESRRS